MSRKNRVKAKLITAPNPILQQVCEPVADGEDVSGIIRDMMHILSNNKSGVGLAAPQAGHLKRIIVTKPHRYSPYTVMINPEFTPAGDSKERGQEGCLSYPNRGQVVISRFTDIDVTYLTESGRDEVRMRAIDWMATIIQHEIDHLDGKCKVGE